MVDPSLIKELESPIELDRNIVKKQGFKTVLGIAFCTAIAGAFIWYINKDDMETAEKHKDKLDVEYVDEAGNIVPKHMVESNDGAYIPDIEKTPYVERKVKRKETDRDTRKETDRDRDRRDREQRSDSKRTRSDRKRGDRNRSRRSDK